MIKHKAETRVSFHETTGKINKIRVKIVFFTWNVGVFSASATPVCPLALFCVSVFKAHDYSWTTNNMGQCGAFPC